MTSNHFAGHRTLTFLPGHIAPISTWCGPGDRASMSVSVRPVRAVPSPSPHREQTE